MAPRRPLWGSGGYGATRIAGPVRAMMLLCLGLLAGAVAGRGFTPQDVPGPPEKILVSSVSDTAMRVQFLPPAHVKPEGVNGAPVLGYKVEVARRVNEVQTFAVAASGPILMGSYKITFVNALGDIGVTSCIPWDASEVVFEMALEELENVDSVSVTRSAYGAVKNGYVYTVTFDGAYLVSGQQANVLVGDQVGCQPAQPLDREMSFVGTHVTRGVSGYYPETWEIVSQVTDGAHTLSGSFDVSVGFEGEWEVDATATATIAAGSRTAITSASMVGRVNRGDKVRIGGEEFVVHASAPFTDSELPLDSYYAHGVTAASIELMDTALGTVQVKQGSSNVATSSDFTGEIALGEHVKIGSSEFSVAAIDATSLTLGDLTTNVAVNWVAATSLHMTAYKRKKVNLRANADAAKVKRALDGLPGIGSIEVSRTGPTNVNGFRWYITFLSLGSKSNCPGSPCLRADKTTGSNELLRDAYGKTCATCVVQASVLQDETSVNTLSGIQGDYAASAIVASHEIGGVVNEVQSISTRATSDDILGSFEVRFQTANGQPPRAVIFYDDTASDVQTKLQNLPTVGRLNVTRMDNSMFGVTWTVSFLTNLGDMPLFTVNYDLLTGSGAEAVVEEVVKGVDVSFETIIDGLAPSQDYYVRAFARNLNGYGISTNALQQRGKGALPLSTRMASSPEAPSITGVWPISGSQLEVRLSNVIDHGAPVEKYIFEYTVGDTFGVPAVKKLMIFNSLENNIAGTFRLQYADSVSPLLSIHSTAASLQSALNGLASIRPVTVTRAVYVLTGEASSCVISFSAASNRLTTTVLTAFQSQLLVQGAVIDVGGKQFEVRWQPLEGDTGIDVALGHNAVDFTENRPVLKMDSSGSERGPSGYEWTISFDSTVGNVEHDVYPGLQLISSLSTVETDSAPITKQLTQSQAAIPATHYGQFEVSNDDEVCDSYTIGSPSAIQVVQLFAPTTITGGTFKLKLGDETTTSCITLGTSAVKSTMKDSLESLKFVSKVTIVEERAFKVHLLTGSASSKVTGYSDTTITVVSTGSGNGLASTDVDALRSGTLIQVSRNPNDFSHHSCEFRVGDGVAEGAQTIPVTAISSCGSFSGEARSLKILDFHDYRIRFWGHYPTGEWPTLQFVPDAFGDGKNCAAWEPALSASIYGQIHTVKYEGTCVQGHPGSQTILADASTSIGGTFILAYMGEETQPLAFEEATASAMRDAIDSITAPGTVDVSVSKYGSYGKAWHVTFVQEQEDQDAIFIKHSHLTGQNALISVYPTVEVFTAAEQDDISGSFRIAFGGEVTESIGFSATHMKVTQELQKLSVVDSVFALGDTEAGDIGVYPLELTADVENGSPTLTSIKLDGAKIDATLFLAIREKLSFGSDVYYVQSITPTDITLTANFMGTTGTTTSFSAGMITKQTKTLPGYVGITRLTQVVAVTKAEKTFELPSGHGYTVGEVFYVGGNAFTIKTVDGTTVVTEEAYPGDTVTGAKPVVYLFDNKLRTTSDLTELVSVGDHLWLRAASADMTRYTVTSVNSRYLEVDGVFTDTIVKERAYHVSNGRRWRLIFRSYLEDLDTIDTIPGNDWRGTKARIGMRRSKAIPPQVVNVGNPASTQTVLVEVTSAAAVGAAATYQLKFGADKTTDILWTSTGDEIKQKLEELDGVDGVSVVSLTHGEGFVHTISFWGTYLQPKLPLLEGEAVPNNMEILVRGADAVAVTKQDNLILNDNQEYAFRIFAVNSKGVSDSASIFHTQTSATSVVPSPPTAVSLGEFHGPTWLSVNYWAPFYSGGADVTMYRIEWDSSPTFDSSSADYGVASIQKQFEVQTVTTTYRSAAGAGGTFTLSWGGRTTSALAFDCSAVDLTEALAIITETTDIAVDPVKVTRAQVSWGYKWKITFLHNPGDLALLVADGSQITGDFPRISVTEVVPGFNDLAIGDFTHEVQEVFTDAKTVLGGYFTLSFEGKATGSISVEASALEMQISLQATTSLYSIKVTKAMRNVAMNTAIWTVTFAYLRGEEMVGAGNIFMMEVEDDTTLTGTSATVRVANKVIGSDPFRYTLTNLRPGVRYYCHVMAYNADGFGSATSPLASAVTCGQPQPPKSVTATVVDGTTLSVGWSASEVVGECDIDKYKIEWYRAEGTQEQQTITTSAGKGLPDIQRLVSFADSNTMGGYFKLAFRGETTQNIAWDAPAVGSNSVKERLERLSTIGTVEVSRDDSKRVVTGLFVTSSGDTATLHDSSTVSKFSDAGLVDGEIIWVAGHQLTIGVVGTSTMTVAPAIDIDIPVAVFKSAFGYEWKITFHSGHVGPQELISVFASDSWTGNNPGITVESIQKGLQPISGTFRVSFASGGLSDTTPPLPHNVSAIALQSALERLVTVGVTDVTRSSNGYGYNWIITFISEFKDDISLLSVDGTELHGPSVRILAARTYAGVQPELYCEQNGVMGAPAEVTIPGSLNYVIRALTTGQKYAIRARAHNAEGFGPAAYITPTFQIPRTIPSAPKDVELLVLSSRYLKARWNAPSSDGGTAITAYKIQWDLASTFPNVNTPNFDYQGELRIVPTDTSPFYFNIPVPDTSAYFVRVFAVNDQGQGPSASTNPSYVRPADRTPGRPEDAVVTVLSSYAILVEWKASSMEKYYYGGDGGLPITQYMIEWDSSSAFDSPASFGLVDGTKRSFIIGGDDTITGVRSDLLIPGTEYSVRVTAFNAKGAGAPRPTDPSSVIVTNQPPTAPQNLQLSVIPATSIKAEWANPLFDGGASLKAYQLEWDEQDDFSSGQSATATIPIVREVQSIMINSDVVNEEQFVDATVEVINEEQVVRTIFTGADEIQVIETTNDEVVDEIQTVVTSATDRDEVQELSLDADDVDEIQAIRTQVTEVFEVQEIQVGATRVDEVQTITINLPGVNNDWTKIGGTLHFSFTASCTHCANFGVYGRTVDLISSLQTSDDAAGAQIVQDALNGLNSIDQVTVGRTHTASAVTTGDLQFVYTITFTGDGIAGDVPAIAIDTTVKVGTQAVTGIPTAATEVTVGNEVTSDSASKFEITYTCESYSDPNTMTSFSSRCTPTSTICASCVTAFDGTTFSTSEEIPNSVSPGDKLVAGVCSFEALTVGLKTITVAADDPGALCSHFEGQQYPLYEAVQYSTSIPLMTKAKTLSDGSTVQNLLTGVINSVTVVRINHITTTFVGSIYAVTFRQRSGMIPLLSCNKDNIGFTNTNSGGAECSVTRDSIGSMISGDFLVGLAAQASSNVVYTTESIPWDASEAVMKAKLEAVMEGTEQVFGTVTVKRSTSFSATASKWSGGYTWTITFTSRGWNIPIMVVNNAGITSSDPAHKPTIEVEDWENHLDPFAGSRDGNEISGTMTFKFAGKTSSVPCVVGTDTDDGSLDQSVVDTKFASFLQDNLDIPSIEVTRSAATQAKGFIWTITFSDPQTGGDVEMLQIPITALVGDGVRTEVTETKKGNQLGGTFQLSFNGETTGPILFSADKLAVQAQLNSLSTIKPSSVVVNREGPAITADNQVLSYTWLITFYSSVWEDPTSDHSSGIAGNWKGASASWDDVWETGYSKAWGRHVGPMNLMTCVEAGLTTTANDGSQHCVVAVDTPGIGPIKGTFTVSVDSTNSPHMSVNALHTSLPIAHHAWATKEESGATGTSVEEIIEAMSNVGDVKVTRSVVNKKTGGYKWTVTFLRDANGPCDQLEAATSGTRLCNAPGNVPLMGFSGTSLSGSNSDVSVDPKQDGKILRGDFTVFKVQNDPGFAARYTVTVSCVNTAGDCSVDTFAISQGKDTLAKYLLVGDRFTVGTHTGCVFKVDEVLALTVKVVSQACSSMNSGTTTGIEMGISVLLPWNADANLVQRVIEASVDTSSGTERKVSVGRTVHGKYGEMSWLVRFISNPTFTPPGAGNLPDITTTFIPNPVEVYDVSVTQVTPGSEGLSGSFRIDFGSSIGPREVSFDEDPDRLQRKLNEMNTIGRVTVKRFNYPSVATGCDDSLCSGGWDDLPVANPGTRGGYRWRIRFMRVTGEYGGLTFPSGSGNVGPLSVSLSTLQGNDQSVDVYTNTAGSAPILGTFVLNTTTKQTPALQYSSSAESIKQGIESMNLFGEVEVTQGYLLTQKVPNAIATISKDALTATITGTDDIRQFIAPSDVIRFGPSSANNLVGTNGDAPFTSVLETSRVTVSNLSPVVVAADPAATKLLYPGMQLRIDGLVYNVQRSGHEIQTVAVTLPVASWVVSDSSGYFQLQLTRAGITQTTTTAGCLKLNQDAQTVEDALYDVMYALDNTAQPEDIMVSRVGPVTTESGARKGYVYSVYFLGDSVAGDVASLTADFGGCTLVTGASVVVSVVRQGGDLPHQRLSLATDSGQVVDDTGYFTMTLNSQTTGCITWGVTASKLEAEFENTLGVGDVIVTRRGSGTSTTELQRLRMTANAEVTASNSGFFQLQFTLDGITAATSCLRYGISAANLQSELNGMTGLNLGVGDINVTREGDGSSTWGFGYEYLIHFRGPLESSYSPVMGNVAQLEIINVGTSPCSPAVIGGHPALIMETVRQGSAGFTYDIFFLDYPDTAFTQPIALQHESNGVCNSGWIHNGGSVRKASIEMISFGGSSEVQSLIVKDTTAGTITASLYKLEFAGSSTGCLASDASASDIKSALDSLASIGTDGVLVSRDFDAVQAPNGYIYRVTFIGEKVTGNVPLLKVFWNDGSCTNVKTSSVSVVSTVEGGVPSGAFALETHYDGETPGSSHLAYTVSQQFSVMSEQFEIQEIRIVNSNNDIAAGATYKLEVKGVTTVSIPWDASESTLQAALTVAGVNAGDIVVTRRTDAELAPNGFLYMVYFSGASVAGNLDLMTKTDLVNLAADNVVLSTTRQGVDGASAFTTNSIPLALPNDPSTASRYLASNAELDLFKVNGFMWIIKFKSTIGNLPALGTQAQALTGGQLAVVDDFVPGSTSNSYTITNLLAGINYYVRVAASTDIGMGPFTASASITPSGTASAVQNIAAGHALYEHEVQEVRLAASHITEVQEITTEAASMSEVQTLRTFASSALCFDGACVKGAFAFRVPTVQTIKISAMAKITAGTFSVKFDRLESNGAGSFQNVGDPTTGVWTTSLAWDADAATMRSALETLDAITPEDIIVTRDGDGSADFDYGYIFQVTFVGTKVSGETLKMEVREDDPFVTTGGVAHNIEVSMNSGMAMGTDTAVQQVIVSAKKPLVVGSYSLTFNHLGAEQTSGCISFDAPARGDGDVRAMENILETMPNIDKVFVTRERDADLAPNGFIYRIFFYGNGVRGAVSLLTYSICDVFKTQENNMLTDTGVDGAVQISMVDQGGFDASNTFVDAEQATAVQLAEDLGRLPIFGNVLVSQSLVDEQGGYIWTVAFKDSEGNLPQFICTVDSVFTTTAATTGASCETDTLTDGNALSGSFVVESSVPISFDASAATMKEALEAMSWVGTVQVMQSAPSPQHGYTWTITFLDYLGDVPTLLITSSLVGTGSNIIVREVRKGNAISGSFTLAYQSSVTAPIESNALASATDTSSNGSSVQEKLEALDVIGRVSVQRSTVDQEGGFTWMVTFLDDVLNPGDIPLLQVNDSALIGEGAVAFTREVIKGSNAVGDQLWLSFDPPVTDNGNPITRYQVRWDTSATFKANPAEFYLTDPEKLYRTQQITTSASSLAWSSVKLQPVLAVQVLTVAALSTGASFKLSFRGSVDSSDIVVGTSTDEDLKAALEALGSVGTVDVTPTASTIEASSVFQITFTEMQGELPLLVSSAPATATVGEGTPGVTNFRKEVQVFSCTASGGDVQFDNGVAKPVDVAYNALLATVEAELMTHFSVEAESIRVTSSQATLCASTGAQDVTITFDRVYGDISLGITATTGTIVRNSAASINGIYNDGQAASMSGTFQVGYKGEYTRPLNAESSADQLRFALEDLASIHTVAVTRDSSFQALPGKVDVTHGQIFVVCASGEVCDFAFASYGLPGYQIRIGGDWYTVRTETTSQSLHETRLYLGDLNGREVGYKGDTDTLVTVYEWTKGYVWTAVMLNVTSPLAYLRAKVPRLYPEDATVRITGSACKKCYYIPSGTTSKLTMGQQYFIEVYAFNENGKGALPVDGPVIATPSQVPSAPSNVDLVVVSGQEIEVFFSPPALATTNVSPNFNNDISAYIVQWDIVSTFKHGRTICSACATELKVNVLTVSTSMSDLLTVGTMFTFADENCVLEVDLLVTSLTVQVKGGHNCDNFNSREYPLYYYTFEPAEVSGALIQGSPPFRYVISDLTTATTYYVRVAAVNSVPVQQIALSGEPPNNRKWSYPLSAFTKDRAPDPPLSVFLYSFSGTTLELQIQPPTRDGKGQGGAAITHFWINVDTVSTFDSTTNNVIVEVEVASGNIPELYAGGPRVYYLTNLPTGTRFFAQVKTKNSVGYSRATLAPTPLAPTRHADSPVNVKVRTVTTSASPINAATVTWQMPVVNGGLALTSYKIEWWRAVSRPEVQVIELKWTTAPTMAPFTLAFGGATTGEVAFDVSAENLRNALMNIMVGATLPVGHIEVSRTTVNIVHGYQWSVTFANVNVNMGDQPMIQLALGTITGGSGITGRVFEVKPGIAVPTLSSFPGRREVQVLVTYHMDTEVAGYFRLSFKGSPWSNYLPASISAANLKLALEALPTIGIVTVNSESVTSSNGHVWTITFESNVGNLPVLIVDPSKLTPSGAFLGVKDGDNAVTQTGVLCLPGEDLCPGSWSGDAVGLAELAAPGEAAVDYGYYETLDASTLTYTIPNLTPGETYLVAVTAKNALGLGVRAHASPATVTPPLQVPGPPTTVSVDVNPGVATQLLATWNAPTSDGGSPVWMYRVEFDPSPLFTDRGQQDHWCPVSPTPAVWRLVSRRSPSTPGKKISSGYFQLSLTRSNAVEVTEPIPWDAKAMASEEIGSDPIASKVFCTHCEDCTDKCLAGRTQTSGSLQSKLQYLTRLEDGVKVSRTTVEAADGGFTWSITFLDEGDDFTLAPSGVSLGCDDTVGCDGATYEVILTKVTAGVSPSACVGSHVLPVVGALNKGQLYNVRVFAYNKVGFGLPSVAPSPQKPMVVPGPPTGVTLTVLTVSELVVLFSPPDDDGGDTVTGYEVQWATDAAFTAPSSALVLILSGVSAPYRRVISSLTKGTLYYVRVKAQNSQGFGVFQLSSPTALQPYTTPSAPRQVRLGVTSATMLTVGWDAPTDNGGDTVSGYVVQWDVAAGFDSLALAASTTAAVSDPTQRSYTITLLTPSTLYYVRVFAKNRGGQGTPQTSTPAALYPTTTRPGKPHSLAAAATTVSGELQITWQPPRVPAHGLPCGGTLVAPQSCPVLGGLDMVFGGTSLESYTVQWALSSDFAGAAWTSVTTTSALVTGLDPGKPYYVRVQTVNSEGQKSDFCSRANANSLLCPDHLVLLDGSVVTGDFVSASPI